MESNNSEQGRSQKNTNLGGQDPLISVIMSVYNSERTVVDALESILNQTYTNWELIVCDDGSTDRTGEILRTTLSSVDPAKYTILTNESNKKLAYSLNRCLKAASGTFIARMDGDDISEPERLERQLRYMLDHPNVDLVGTAFRRFNSDGLGDLVLPASHEPDKWDLGKGSQVPFAHPTILARRSVFADVGNYTDAWYTVRTEDLDLWFKFFAANKVGRNMDEALYRFREDEAAIRRRTPKARFNAFVTRLKGNRVLRYPIRSYVPAVSELLKIFVPYAVFDWHRSRSRKKAVSVSRSEG